MKHLVFYDGTCGLCDRIVQFLLGVDKEGLFVFAPLKGSTANQFLNELNEEQKKADSLILIENYQEPEKKKYFLYGKGALRILWLLGGGWVFIGMLNFLPSGLFDWIYQWVAKHRHQWFSNKECILPNPKYKNRFLP